MKHSILSKVTKEMENQANKIIESSEKL